MEHDLGHVVANLLHRPAPKNGGAATQLHLQPRHLEDTAGFLAGLLDFAGSINLAQVLDDVPADDAGQRGAVSGVQGGPLYEFCRKELGRIENRLLLRFAPERMPLMPGHMYNVLHNSHSKNARGDLTAATLRKLATPFSTHLEHAVQAAQKDILKLREELVTPLHQLGSRASRLEQLDAALRESTEARVAAFLDRLLPAYDKVFARGLKSFRRLHGGLASRAELERAFTQEGWVGQHLRLGEQAAHAVFVLRRVRLLALVQGAVEDCSGGGR